MLLVPDCRTTCYTIFLVLTIVCIIFRPANKIECFVPVFSTVASFDKEIMLISIYGYNTSPSLSIIFLLINGLRFCTTCWTCLDGTRLHFCFCVEGILRLLALLNDQVQEFLLVTCNAKLSWHQKLDESPYSMLFDARSVIFYEHFSFTTITRAAVDLAACKLLFIDTITQFYAFTSTVPQINT